MNGKLWMEEFMENREVVGKNADGTVGVPG